MRACWQMLLGVPAALLVGCASGSPPTPPVPSAPATAAAAASPDPVTVCANQLVYWAGEQLRGAPDGGLDYQEMGLTSAQADALGTLVDQARAQGPGRAAGFVPARARELCTQIVARPRPTGGSWPS
jgi:hypothetical protein